MTPPLLSYPPLLIFILIFSSPLRYMIIDRLLLLRFLYHQISRYSRIRILFPLTCHLRRSLYNRKLPYRRRSRCVFRGRFLCRESNFVLFEYWRIFFSFGPRKYVPSATVGFVAAEDRGDEASWRDIRGFWWFRWRGFRFRSVFWFFISI